MKCASRLGVHACLTEQQCHFLTCREFSCISDCRSLVLLMSSTCIPPLPPPLKSQMEKRRENLNIVQNLLFFLKLPTNFSLFPTIVNGFSRIIPFSYHGKSYTDVIYHTKRGVVLRKSRRYYPTLDAFITNFR